MPETHDDLDAVKTVVDALEKFDSPEERERILRWSREKLGLTTPPPLSSPATESKATQRSSTHPGGGHTTDIRAFVTAKNPTSDNQFAAVVAYFYKFEAAEGAKKDAIGSDDLLEACRLAGRARPSRPVQTLTNALGVGLLDRTGDRGMFKINSVGENLVAMTLPGDGTQAAPPSARRKTPKKKTTKKKTTKKKTSRPRKK